MIPFVTRASQAPRLIALAVIAILAAVLGVTLAASPAHAAARVDVSPAPNAEGTTTVTLSGSGFQYQPNAPGGIYVGFGSVQDPATNSWAPSQGGKSGTTFGYASGSTLLIAFEGGSSAEASNATIDANGNWTAQMKIPGAVFASSSGNPHSGEAHEGAQIDCTKVQCGIITFGAHGMINANNESFTPVSFVTSGGEVVSGSGGASFTDDATQLEIPAEGEQDSSAGDTDAEQPTTSAEESSEQAAPETEKAEPAEPEPVAAKGGLSSTALVLGVFGFAVLVLLAAIIVTMVRRKRAAAAVAPAAAQVAPTVPTAAPTAPTAPTAAPTAPAAPIEPAGPPETSDTTTETTTAEKGDR